MKVQFALLTVLLAFSPLVLGQEAAGDLARKVQNPVEDMISFPLQWNWNFDTGPLEKDQHIVNLQPVVPFSLNDDWSLISRTIVPLMSQPPFAPGQGRENGIGDVNLSLFFSPKEIGPGGWIWGVGPALVLDTATDDRLGQGAWSAGPTGVALKMIGPWVLGALVSNVWSFSEDDGRSDVNQFLLQPFVNYNFPNKPGRYLSFSPIITANWEADGGNTWTVPLGLGIGQIAQFGKLPVNLALAYYYNVERPENASRYQLRFQVTLLFPQ